MIIVILDGYTLNPGDLSWDSFKSIGACRIFDRTPPDKIIDRCQGAEIVITNKTPLTRETIEALPDLRYIGVIATGYNVVDVQAARQKGIVVTNVPTYGTDSVAQMTIALILELTRQVGHHATTVRGGRWSKAADWCYWDFPQIELNELTLGLIGLGRIGRSVANLAHAFGLHVLGYDPLSPRDLPAAVRLTNLDHLLENSDIVSLHCPLTENNFQLINHVTIGQMKQTAYLINTSRGQLINDQDLAQALNTGRLAGAGIDVLSTEPPAADNPLLNAKNCIITPHLAWSTSAARVRLMRTAVKNLSAFISGRPENVVN